MVVKPSCKEIKNWVLEEKTTSKMYGRYGFKGPSRDELKHSKFFSKALQKCRSSK